MGRGGWLCSMFNCRAAVLLCIAAKTIVHTKENSQARVQPRAQHAWSGVIDTKGRRGYCLCSNLQPAAFFSREKHRASANGTYVVAGSSQEPSQLTGALLSIASPPARSNISFTKHHARIAHARSCRRTRHVYRITPHVDLARSNGKRSGHLRTRAPVRCTTARSPRAAAGRFLDHGP